LAEHVTGIVKERNTYRTLVGIPEGMEMEERAPAMEGSCEYIE
jgi:hypothetical protein